MVKPTFKIIMGNPKDPDGGTGTVVSSEDSPIIGGMEGADSKVHFDNGGNLFVEASNKLFQKGTEVFSNFEKHNMVIQDEYTLNALNVVLDIVSNLVLRSQNVDIAGEQVTISADDTLANLAPNVLLGRINKDIFTATSDGEQYTSDEELRHDLSQYDEVMTKSKFVKWWNTFFSPFLDEYKSFKEKYNNHTNAGQPIDATFKINSSKEDKPRNISSLLVSKTTKAV